MGKESEYGKVGMVNNNISSLWSWQCGWTLNAIPVDSHRRTHTAGKIGGKTKAVYYKSDRLRGTPRNH